MTLRLIVDVNGERLGAIHLRNIGHPDHPLTWPADDDLRRYQCVLYRNDIEPLAVWVDHRRGDGWLALTTVALAALQGEEAERDEREAGGDQ